MLVLHSSSECDICYLPFGPSRPPYAIPCGHIYCSSCLNETLDKACGQCRKHYDITKIKRIYAQYENDADEPTSPLSEPAFLLLRRLGAALRLGDTSPSQHIRLRDILTEVDGWLNLAVASRHPVECLSNVRALIKEYGFIYEEYYKTQDELSRIRTTVVEEVVYLRKKCNKLVEDMDAVEKKVGIPLSQYLGKPESADDAVYERSRLDAVAEDQSSSEEQNSESLRLLPNIKKYSEPEDLELQAHHSYVSPIGSPSRRPPRSLRRARRSIIRPNTTDLHDRVSFPSRLSWELEEEGSSDDSLDDPQLLLAPQFNIPPLPPEATQTNRNSVRFATTLDTAPPSRRTSIISNSSNSYSWGMQSSILAPPLTTPTWGEYSRSLRRADSGPRSRRGSTSNQSDSSWGERSSTFAYMPHLQSFGDPTSRRSSWDPFLLSQGSDSVLDDANRVLGRRNSVQIRTSRSIFGLDGAGWRPVPLAAVTSRESAR